MKINRIFQSFRLAHLYNPEIAAASDPIYGWPTIRSKQESPLQKIAPGVTYQSITYRTSDGPVVVHETWVTLTEPGVRLRTVMSGDRLENERNETLQEMGRRRGAVAGINGDFFESGASGMALNMTIDQGKLLHHPSPAAVFGVTANNRVTIGKFGFSGNVTAATGQTFPLRVLNGHPVTYPNDLILLTAELGHYEMAKSATVLTLLIQADGRYKVAGIETKKEVVEAPYPGGVKLLAQGTSKSFVDTNIKTGDLLQISYDTVPSSKQLRYAIGGGPIWMKDGKAFYDPNPPAPVSSTRRDPQTGVGVTADGDRLLMVVVDGRSRQSMGLTQSQMANYLAARGAYEAMLFDGGGSSEMVVRLPGNNAVSIVNQPSDGSERRIANGLFVFYEQPPAKWFPDVVGHWAQTYIEELTDRNIVFPVHSNVFAPDQAVTRAEVISFIVRALNLQPVATTQFSDVPLDVGYNGAVGAAVKANIAGGVGNGRFAPADPLVRSQAAVMFCNAIWAAGNSPQRGGTPILYKDRDLIPKWAIIYVDALSALKLMVGDADGYFRPSAEITRAEAAALTYRVMQYCGLI